MRLPLPHRRHRAVHPLREVGMLPPVPRPPRPDADAPVADQPAEAEGSASTRTAGILRPLIEPWGRRNFHVLRAGPEAEPSAPPPASKRPEDADPAAAGTPEAPEAA